MIELDDRGLSRVPTERDVDAARAQFRERHHLRLYGFLSRALLEKTQTGVERARFQRKQHGDVGVELCMLDDRTTDMLAFLLNEPALLRFVEAVAEVPHLGSFAGRIYRFVPGEEHVDHWHDDLVDHRLVGMSVNLSASAFDGGRFTMRDAGTHRQICDIANTGPGDAILFRLAPHLEHRIGDMEGSATKTAYAGWFKEQPEFRDVLRKRPRDG